VGRYDEVEPILASLRVAGCVIDEMEMTHTDLEEVFLRIMRQEAA
jgi:ABC-2 type transport system ATP-binding protein